MISKDIPNETLNSKVNLASSDFHLLHSMALGLADLQFINFEEVQNWLVEWFLSKGASFHRRDIYKLADRCQRCVASER